MDRKHCLAMDNFTCEVIRLLHPTTGEQLVFEAPLPEVFEKLYTN